MAQKRYRLWTKPTGLLARLLEIQLAQPMERSAMPYGASN